MLLTAGGAWGSCRQATSLEGASRPGADPGLSADSAGRPPSQATAVDREEPPAPVLSARLGHGRRERTRLGPGGSGAQLERRARFVLGDHLPRWQAVALAVRHNGDSRVRPSGLRPWLASQKVLSRNRPNAPTSHGRLTPEIIPPCSSCWTLPRSSVIRCARGLHGASSLTQSQRGGIPPERWTPRLCGRGRW
jgi:hypothetical protein